MPRNRKRGYMQYQEAFLNYFMYGVEGDSKVEGALDLFLMYNDKSRLLSTWQLYREEILKRWDHPEIEPYGVLVFDMQKEIIDLEIYRKLFDEN